MRFERMAALAVVLSLVPSALTAATREPVERIPHVRGLKDGALDAGRLLAEANERSSTFRGLIAALDATDVLVYVELKKDISTRTGMLRLISAAGGKRHLLVSIDLRNSHPQRMSWLGHELRHALEVAANPDVRDEAGLRSLYERIGRSSGDSRFETEAATETGLQVSAEVRGIADGRR